MRGWMEGRGEGWICKREDHEKEGRDEARGWIERGGVWVSRMMRGRGGER